MRRGIRARGLLLAVYGLATAGWYLVFLSDWNPLGMSVQWDGSPVTFVIGTLIVLLIQAGLLAGAPQLHWPRPRSRRSMAGSLLAGSLIAVLLSTGIVLACASLVKLIRAPSSFRSIHITSITPATAPAAPPSPPPRFDWQRDVPWGLTGTLLGGWAFWFAVFALAWGGPWPRRFSRMYRMLVAGTVLELLITIPVDAHIRRRTSCYCDEGTFYALAIGLTAVVWTFGPGVAILFLLRRRERLLASGRCVHCGYDLRGITSSRCPECGVVFAAPAQPA